MAESYISGHGVGDGGGGGQAPHTLMYSVVFVILATLGTYLASRRKNTFPTLNGKKFLEFSEKRIKTNFIVNGRKMLRDGLKMFEGRPFNVETDHGPVLIFAPSYANELRKLEGLNHVKAIGSMVHAHLPGFEAFYEFAYRDDLIQDVVRVKVTQSLGAISKSISEETSLALRDHFTDSKEWHSFGVHSVMLPAVARVSSRLFLGDKLCRDPDWLRITTTYTHHIVAAVHEVNSWPALLRGIISPYLPLNKKLVSQVEDAHRVMGKVLKERRALKAKGQAPEYIDAIEWFDQSAKGRKYDPVNIQLTLSFVAIHTTAEMMTQLIFDLAQHPELIQPLREEAIEVLGKYGWQKTSLYNMKLMDSVLKECLRLKPINDTVLQRLALKDIKLADGTFIPKNTFLAMASTRHWDEDFYPEPEKFDGYRFLKMRAAPGKDNTAQFVTTSADHLGFGHGEHACPGRFFASNEIKIILCHMLLKYDWELVEGQQPKTMAYGWVLASDHKTHIRVRRRQEELDIDNL